MWIILLPSICFWLTAGSLHLLGFNRSYKGPVTVCEMVASQLAIDVIQAVFGYVTYDGVDCASLSNMLIALCLVDVVEYVCHRALHEVAWLKPIHKRHHRLVTLHTLGAYYNDLREVAFTGSTLAIVFLSLNSLNSLEMAIVASIATVANVYHHCPTQGNGYHRHELHHVYGKGNYAQPFTGFLDWVCHTRMEDLKQ
jgi:sterol desaturase/sphingolipid hydroxylase (fatty acid hydroxylase superfamily)